MSPRWGLGADVARSGSRHLRAWLHDAVAMRLRRLLRIPKSMMWVALLVPGVFDPPANVCDACGIGGR